MEYSGIFVFCMVSITCLVSYYGIKDPSFMARYSFQVDAILIHKEYKRLLTSGFLHTGWMHLIFNMITLYYFSRELEIVLGLPKLMLLYGGSLLGGNLFALYIHRNHGDYSAVGASGAISGMVFGSIALFPGMEMSLLIIPYYIPSWAFGLLYVLYSLYGIQSQRDNVGHEAHLGGGLIGMIIVIAFYPSVVAVNYLPIALITIPCLLFLYFMLTRPDFLMVENPFKTKKGVFTFEDKANDNRKRNERELDQLLDKIGRLGINGLTKQEKERLDQLSNPKNR
jgi:membrane associated rhomboid family serine protease